MKSLYNIALWLLALLCITSCRDANPFGGGYEDGRSEMEISGKIDHRLQTRADDLGFADGDAIGVYIVDYVNGEPGELKAQGNHATNVKFTYDESTDTWEGAAKIYWTDDRTPIDGYSYYPFREVVNDPHALAFTVLANQDRQDEDATLHNYEASDLLWAKAENVSPGEVIDLRHRHLMAGVQINLIPGTGFDAAAWAELEKSVLINQVQASATVDLVTGQVTPSGDERITVVPHVDGNTYRAVILPCRNGFADELELVVAFG